jgi:glucokinase
MTVAVGIDLGGTHARAALVDVERGSIINGDAKRELTDRSPDAVAALLSEIVRAVDPQNKRVGVGVGIAAMLRGWTGVVVNAPNLGWREIDFRSLLRERVGAQVQLYNDLNAIAFGEARFGGARGIRDVLFVFIGTGVGAGVVLDGALYIGSNHLAGEFGHVKVVPADAPGARLCGCGQHGCLEAYTSGRNIQSRLREELPKQKSLIVELAGGLERVHAGHLDEAARRGDPYGDRLLDEVAQYLGLALANAVTLLNPSRLVLGGGVWQGSPELRRRALARFESAVNAASREGFSIAESALGDSAGVLGSAALIGTAPATTTK